ncbi:hypothetical protein L1887_29326 [Cichorium endivia]|nr:hypothetical protein L1887_29326 [Cichorium endivia]
MRRTTFSGDMKDEFINRRLRFIKSRRSGRLNEFLDEKMAKLDKSRWRQLRFEDKVLAINLVRFRVQLDFSRRLPFRASILCCINRIANAIRTVSFLLSFVFSNQSITSLNLLLSHTAYTPSNCRCKPLSSSTTYI